MSEPVAWRVDMGEHGWYLFGNFQDARKHCADDEEPEPLYPADAIERKDVAIAELVGALKKLQYAYRQVEGLHEPDMHDVFTMASQNMIAKYDK